MKKKYFSLEKRVIVSRGGGYYKQSGGLGNHVVLGEERRGVMPNMLQIKMFAYLKLFGIMKV